MQYFAHPFMLRTWMLCGSLLLSTAWAQTSVPTNATAPQAGSVKVARLDSVWIQPERNAPASVQARNVSRLSAEVAGTLLRWEADVGANVQRGQLLAQIDPRDAELNVQRAQAALNASQSRVTLSQAQLKRAEELVQQGFYSEEALLQRQTEVNLMQAELQSQRAQLASAQRQLNKTNLRAPFAGAVQERLAQTGEAVSPGTVLFVLVESGQAEVQASIDPNDALSLQRSTRIWLQTAQHQDRLRLLRLSSAISTPSRTKVARLAFVDAPRTAGTTGTLHWLDPQTHIPATYIVKRQQQLGVFVQTGSGDQARASFVTLPSAQEGRPSPVPPSLNGNIVLVVQGQAALQDQAPITVR